MTKSFTLTVNGKIHTVEADPDMPLLYALRDELGLNNPKFGCGRSASADPHPPSLSFASARVPSPSRGEGRKHLALLFLSHGGR